MLIPYAAGTVLHDHALAGWWLALTQAGELEPLFPVKDWALGPFLARFRPPTRCYLAADATGLWAAIWASPWVGGAIPGLWVRPDRRRTKAALRAVEEGVGALLAEWPVLVVVTRAPARRDLYAHFGVAFSPAPIPALFDGEAVWLGWLTADTFVRRCTPAVAGVAA